MDFLTPSRSRLILNSKCVRRECLVGPRSTGVNPGFVPEFLAGLAKTWPSLHLLAGWNFLPRCTSIHSPKAQLCSRFPAPRLGPVQPLSHCLPLLVCFLLEYKHIQGLHIGTSVPICRLLSPLLGPGRAASALSCVNDKWDQREDTQQTKRGRGSHKI